MPQYCIVPKCKSKISGHRLLKNIHLRKQWLIAIRREAFKPSEHSRVCNLHFKESDYRMPLDSVREKPKPLLRAGAVPSVFDWTATPTVSALNRAARVKARHQAKALDAHVIPIPDVIMPFDKEQFFNVSDVIVVECPYKEEEIQCNLKAILTDKSTNTDGNSHSETTHKCSGKFKIGNWKSKEHTAELQFYTGFEDYDHFMLIFNILGPQVNHLKYYPNFTNSSHLMSPVDEFLLTIIKLRRGMVNKELAFRFGIRPTLASNIFITWINFLYVQFKELNIWPSDGVVKENLRFKGEDCMSTAIIDCTEVKMIKPKNSLAQQQTYSAYKSCNTLKVLVGISPTGAITFVSDTYGGAGSDRAIFEKSGLIDLLGSNDCVMADRGFQIQDLLCHKNIKLHIPAFLNKNASQFEPKQLDNSKFISSKRIHVERIIGLEKTYRILTIPFTPNLFALGNRIVFVCFMLANLRMNIM